MASEAARRHIARLFAERVTERPPLAQSRREWDERGRALPLPAGTRITADTCGGVAGEWVDVPGADAQRVFLLLHGGGYVSGSPRTHRKLAAHIGVATRMRVLVPDYRLAPENPFPAGLTDARSVLDWLLASGRQPGDIVVGGDSAGGGLALSLLLDLRAGGGPQPSGAVLMSPWTDLTVSSPSYARNEALDPVIAPARLGQSGRWYAGEGDPRDPRASPLFADLDGLAPLLIHVGGDETMLDDSRLFAERASAAGVEVAYRMFPGLWHVFHNEVPAVPEAVEAMAEIGAWVRARTGTA